MWRGREVIAAMRRVLILLTIAVLKAAALPASTMPADAQGLSGFFDRLFRPGPRFFPRELLPPGQVGKRPVRQAPAEPPVPKVEVLPKDPKARKVVVIGDFLATGLAAGLDQVFAETPQIAIVDKSEGSSGLVRLDRYDWTKKLPEVLNEVQPDYVVVMIGTNDRQQMGPKGAKAPVRSEAWTAVYNERLANLAATLKLYGRPLFWVGLPPMRSGAASADMAAFNAIYKVHTESIGGKFVDVWNGFANEEGKYVSRAPDVAGQVRLLRSGDGINFTRAGQNKLAFFVEREIRRLGGIGTGEALATSTTPGERIEVSPDGRRWLVGPVISLNEPPPGSPTELIGGTKLTEPAKESPQYKLVVEGASLPAVTGRVDDYRWPGSEAASPQAAIPPSGETAATAILPGATAPLQPALQR
jgi:hypothetical protein